MVSSINSTDGNNRPQSITDMAQRGLHERLVSVCRYAPLAANHWKEDIEYVHQLRVATREARAALRVFADFLPQRETRWAKRVLRRLRKAAGDARDLDVLGERLTIESNGGDLDNVIDQIAVCRREAQTTLMSAYRKAIQKGFTERFRTLVNAVCWQLKQPEPPSSEVVRTMLAPLVEEFFTSAGGDLSDIAVLHDMRIAGKQIRYAMDLLEGAADDSLLRRLRRSFKDVQEKLGKINDHATATATLNRWTQPANRGGSTAEVAGLIEKEETLLLEECHRFRDWWTAERVAKLSEDAASVLQSATFSEAEANSRSPGPAGIRNVETMALASQ